MNDVIHVGEFLLGVLTALASLFASIFWASRRLARLELKTDTMWDFIMHRALAEVIRKNYGMENSPLKIADHIRSSYGPLADDLRNFFKKAGRQMTDRELFIEIQTQFGERIFREVCMPQGMEMGACVLVACEIARES
jgi:hypothetical protein